MPKCPHCPAEYSTEQEVSQHLGRHGQHVIDRMQEAHEVTKLSLVQVTEMAVSAGAVVAAAQAFVNSATAKVARYRRVHLENALSAHRLKFPPDETTPW